MNLTVLTSIFLYFVVSVAEADLDMSPNSPTQPMVDQVVNEFVTKVLEIDPWSVSRGTGTACDEVTGVPFYLLPKTYAEAFHLRYVRCGTIGTYSVISRDQLAEKAKLYQTKYEYIYKYKDVVISMFEVSRQSYAGGPPGRPRPVYYSRAVYPLVEQAREFTSQSEATVHAQQMDVACARLLVESRESK